MHIQTGPNLENDADVSQYLLPFQADYVFDESPLQLTEKANRIGFTWTDALRAVRGRFQHAKRDYLFTTQNWNGSIEYGRYIDQWLNLYNYGKYLISKSEQSETVPRQLDDGTKVAEQVKVGVYKFDNGSRILLFPSAPWAIQTFEGDVGWDEADFHDQQEQMWAAIATRLQWGFNASAWSACNHANTWWQMVLCKNAREPGSGWKYRKITIHDAINDGIVERINAKSGRNMTREEFLADCRRRAVTPEIFAARFECNPSNSANALTDWATIEGASRMPILRAHMDAETARRLFGLASDHPTDAAIANRTRSMKAWLEDQFGTLAANNEPMRLGYDVAASDRGDLGSFWLSAKKGTRYEQRALLTTQTEDWHFHNAAMSFFMERFPATLGAGDKTGLGRETTWKAEQKYKGRFAAVPFTAESKSEMGVRLMSLFSSGEMLIAKREVDGTNADVGMDFFSLQRSTSNGRVTFTATANPLNKASHCDMAWSAALAASAEAMLDKPQEQAPVGVSRVRRMGRGVLGMFRRKS